jgi:hypothetical protein
MSSKSKCPSSPSACPSLATTRSPSSIPSSDGTWEYPSADQFQQALLRKEKPAPPENVQTMVDIHNFLNEECWKEIIKWELKYHPHCLNHFLTKFEGKPQKLSPLARFYSTVYGFEKLTL